MPPVPGAPPVPPTGSILIGSSRHGDHEDFRDALLGSHVERWDAFPPRGKRIAHGRAADGLWHANRYAESTTAGWFELDPGRDGLDVRVVHRETIPPDAALRETLGAIFGGGERDGKTAETL